jgi:hypothetical protein
LEQALLALTVAVSVVDPLVAIDACVALTVTPVTVHVLPPPFPFPLPPPPQLAMSRMLNVANASSASQRTGNHCVVFDMVRSSHRVVAPCGSALMAMPDERPMEGG